MLIMRADHVRSLLHPCTSATLSVKSGVRGRGSGFAGLTASTGLIAVAPLAPCPDAVDRAGGLERARDFLRVAVLRYTFRAAVCLTKQTCTSSQRLSAVDGRAFGVFWAWLRTA